MPKSRLMAHIAGGVAIAFGALTIASGGRSLLGLADMGAVVPFVLWFNTLAGPAYILAGLGLWQARRWAFLLSLAIFAATLLAFAGLGHVDKWRIHRRIEVMSMKPRKLWAVLS